MLNNAIHVNFDENKVIDAILSTIKIEITSTDTKFPTIEVFEMAITILFKTMKNFAFSMSQEAQGRMVAVEEFISKSGLEQLIEKKPLH